MDDDAASSDAAYRVHNRRARHINLLPRIHGAEVTRPPLASRLRLFR
jgi:hypothetical protein